jgi:hypothetical protein
VSQAAPAGRLTPQQAWEILAEVQAGEHHDEHSMSLLWVVLEKLRLRHPPEADEIEYARRLIEERITEAECPGNVLEAFDVRADYTRCFYTETKRLFAAEIHKHGARSVGRQVEALAKSYDGDAGCGFLNAFVDAEFEVEAAAEALKAKAAPAGVMAAAGRRPRRRGTGRRSRSQPGRRRDDGPPRPDDEPDLARAAAPPRLHLILELEQDPVVWFVTATDTDTRRLLGWLRRTDWLRWLPAAVLAAVDRAEHDLGQGRRR